MDGTGGNTLLTDDAARSHELQLEGLGMKIEGFRGANAGTEAAVHTNIFIDDNFPTRKGHAHILRSHPINGGFKFINIPQEFHHQLAHLIRGHLGADNIGRHVEFLRQAVGNRHLHRASGKGERDSFFHPHPLLNNLNAAL